MKVTGEQICSLHVEGEDMFHQPSVDCISLYPLCIEHIYENLLDNKVWLSQSANHLSETNNGPGTLTWVAAARFDGHHTVYIFLSEVVGVPSVFILLRITEIVKSNL